MATTKVTTDVIDMSGNTGGLVWAKGATGDRPTGVTGDLRENTTTFRTEVFNGTAWRNLKEAPPTLAVEYLIVAGGGGGGGMYRGGGGGAGGLKTNYNVSTLSLSQGTAYDIIVGPGGAGVTQANGIPGTASQFSDIISAGGGFGSFYGANNAGAGGSGGGSSGYAGGTPGNAGAASPTGQGNAGGQGATGPQCGGGGGGAGAVGNAGGSNSTDGDGGAGLENQITGATGIFYAGGGGGGNYGTGNVTIGGSGIGGAGGTGTYNNGNNGTINTGSGGGGSSGGETAPNGFGGTGGSGIVILRCTKATATISAGITVNGISAAGSVSGDTTNMPAGEYFYSATSGTGTITFS